MSSNSHVVVMKDQENEGSRSFSLPSPPKVLLTILEAASDPSSASLKRLSELVSASPVFVAELLRVANSPLYGLKDPTTTVRRAITIVGLRGLQTLVLRSASRSCVRATELGRFDLGRFWANSLRRAVAARILAERFGLGNDPWEAFTVGLLQDLGVLALIRSRPKVADRWSAHVGASPKHRRAIERAVFGTTHDALADKLAKAWFLPEALAVPMRWHHEPEKAPLAHRDMARVACLAEDLAEVLSADDKAAAVTNFEKAAQLTPEETEALLVKLEEGVAEAALLMEVDVSDQPSVQSILAVANHGLVTMNQTYESLVRELQAALDEIEILKQKLDVRTAQLERIATTDEVTGLPNRRAWTERVDFELKRIAQQGGSLVLLVVDIDRFKQVSDAWGHALGARVLAGVAQVLQDNISETDFAARIEGEGFAVLLTAADARAGQQIAKQILVNVSKKRFSTPGSASIRVTCSIGVCAAKCSGFPSVHKVDIPAFRKRFFAEADTAQYQAKQAGRARAVMARALTLTEEETRATD